MSTSSSESETEMYDCRGCGKRKQTNEYGVCYHCESPKCNKCGDDCYTECNEEYWINITDCKNDYKCEDCKKENVAKKRLCKLYDESDIANMRLKFFSLETSLKRIKQKGSQVYIFSELIRFEKEKPWIFENEYFENWIEIFEKQFSKTQMSASTYHSFRGNDKDRDCFWVIDDDENQLRNYKERLLSYRGALFVNILFSKEGKVIIDNPTDLLKCHKKKEYILFFDIRIPEDDENDQTIVPVVIVYKYDEKNKIGSFPLEKIKTFSWKQLIDKLLKFEIKDQEKKMEHYDNLIHWIFNCRFDSLLHLEKVIPDHLKFDDPDKSIHDLYNQIYPGWYLLDIEKKLSSVIQIVRNRKSLIASLIQILLPILIHQVLSEDKEIGFLFEYCPDLKKTIHINTSQTCLNFFSQRDYHIDTEKIYGDIKIEQKIFEKDKIISHAFDNPDIPDYSNNFSQILKKSIQSDMMNYLDYAKTCFKESSDRLFYGLFSVDLFKITGGGPTRVSYSFHIICIPDFKKPELYSKWKNGKNGILKNANENSTNSYLSNHFELSTEKKRKHDDDIVLVNDTLKDLVESENEFSSKEINSQDSYSEESISEHDKITNNGNLKDFVEEEDESENDFWDSEESEPKKPLHHQERLKSKNHDDVSHTEILGNNHKTIVLDQLNAIGLMWNLINEKLQDELVQIIGKCISYAEKNDKTVHSKSNNSSKSEKEKKNSRKKQKLV